MEEGLIVDGGISTTSKIENHLKSFIHKFHASTYGFCTEPQHL